MHSNILNKNKLKLFNTANSDLAGRISILENNVYKITYYEIISGASGSLTIPTGATINANEFSGANCILSEIDVNNKPTWVSPKDAGGTVVTATLNTSTGAWLKSGVTVSANVALIYSLNIRAADYFNLTNFYIIDEVVIGDFTYVLNNTTNNSVLSSLLASAMSDETGSGALVFGTSPTFTTNATLNNPSGSAVFYVNRPSNGWSAMSIYQTAGVNQWGYGLFSGTANESFSILDSVANVVRFSISRDTVGYINMGNYASPTAQRLVTIGQDTAWMSFGSYTGDTSAVGIYFNQTTPSSTNHAIYATSSSTQINSTSSIYLTRNGSSVLGIANSGTVMTFTPAASSGGSTTNFTFTKPNNTGQTLDTAIPGWLFTTGSRTWATSANIAQQNEIDITAPSWIAPAGTIQNGFTMYVRQPTISGGASMTRAFALGLDGNMSITNNKILYGVDSAGTYRAIMTWSSGDNIQFTGRPGVSDIVLNPTSGGVGLYVKSNGDVGIGNASPSGRLNVVKTTEQLRVGYDTSNYLSTTVSSVGDTTLNLVGTGTKLLNITAGTSVGLRITNNAVITAYFGADGSGAYAGSLTAHDFYLYRGNSLKATLTSTSFLFADSYHLQFNTTNGSKIGTSSSQKIGKWGVTPIVQPSGWGTPTGSVTRTTFDTTTVTLSELAERVAGLITDLKATGEIGA